MFLDFTIFCRRFIRNFSRIATSLTSVLQIINNNGLNTQVGQNEKNQGVSNGASGDASGDEANGSIEYLLTATKMAKPKLTKPKESDFTFFGADFLTSKAKRAFIHLQKAFTKALILRHFDPKCYIRIETDALRYAIDRVLSQLTSKISLAGQITQKSSGQLSLPSEIGQWHPVAFFFQKMIFAETRYKTLRLLRLGAIT